MTYGGHVDSKIGDADDGGEDHWGNPMNTKAGTQTRTRKPKQSNGKTRYSWKAC